MSHYFQLSHIVCILIRVHEKINLAMQDVEKFHVLWLMDIENDQLR